MLECLIIGDSIAVGTKMFSHKNCASYAHVGYNSHQWNQRYSHADLSANIVVISLGSNDGKSIDSEHEMRNLRQRIKGKRVFWILPHGNNPKGGVSVSYIDSIVRKIANENGDTIIPIKSVQPDKVHPIGHEYEKIAKRAGI